MVQVIGHRGAAALAPENTLEGIKVASQCGTDYVEVDVRLSKDGYLVLMHDETTDRTAGKSSRIDELNLEDIKKLTVGGKEIPTLDEAIHLAMELDLGLVVEMKEEGCEELLIEALDRTRLRDRNRLIITSFFHSSLWEIKELSNFKTGIILSSLPIKPVDLAIWAKAEAIFPKRVNPRLFKDAHRLRLEIFPWTINTKEEAEWLLRLGADGLVTDDPCLIRKIRDQPIQATGQKNCDYYPCHHFPNQDCTHCFCPLYPCRDLKLGRFVKTKRGKRFWSCIDCSLVHEPEAARYLESNPKATTANFIALFAKKDETKTKS